MEANCGTSCPIDDARHWAGRYVRRPGHDATTDVPAAVDVGAAASAHDDVVANDAVAHDAVAHDAVANVRVAYDAAAHDAIADDAIADDAVAAGHGPATDVGPVASYAAPAALVWLATSATAALVWLATSATAALVWLATSATVELDAVS